MPGHRKELKTNAHVGLRPHPGGRPGTSQLDFESGLHWGLHRAALTPGVHSRVRGQAADLCQCPAPRLNGVLLTSLQGLRIYFRSGLETLCPDLSRQALLGQGEINNSS